MPQRKTSSTRVLPNGNRVTITVGAGRRGTYKTVTVRRPDGTSDSRTFNRGLGSTYFLGGYDKSVPNWASNSSGNGSGSGSGSGSKRFWLVLIAALYLLWPLAIGAKTLHGQPEVSSSGIIVLAIWLPIAIGIPILIWRSSVKGKRVATGRVSAATSSAQVQLTGSSPVQAAKPSGTWQSDYRQTTAQSSAPPAANEQSLGAARIPPTKPRERSSHVVFPPDRDVGWAALYLASEIARGLAEYENDYHDYLLGVIRPTGEVVSAPRDVLSALTDELRAGIENVSRLVNNGIMKGTSTDESLIRRTAADFVDMYALMIAWGQRLRGATVPDRWLPAFRALSHSVSLPLRQIRKFSEDYCEVMGRNVADRRAGHAPAPTNLTLTLALDPKASAEFKEALAQLNAPDGDPHEGASGATS